MLLLELKQRNYRELYKNACRNIRHETMIESLCICRNEAEDDAAPTADDRVFHAHAAATGQWAAIPGEEEGRVPLNIWSGGVNGIVLQCLWYL